MIGGGNLENHHQGRDARDKSDDRCTGTQTFRIQNDGAIHHNHTRDKIEKEKHKEVIHLFWKLRVASRLAQADFLEDEAVYAAGKNESNKPAPTSAMPK